MRLKDYFTGLPVRLQSRLSARTVADRINDAAGSPFWPFNFGVVGRVRFGRVSLRYRSSLFEYNQKPVLVGRLRDDGFGTELTLRYRAPASAYLFFAFWYLLLPVFAIALLFGETDPPLTGSDRLLFAVVTCGMLAVPVGMSAFGTRNSDEELSEMIEFLAREAEAQPQPSL